MSSNKLKEPIVSIDTALFDLIRALIKRDKLSPNVAIDKVANFRHMDPEFLKKKMREKEPARYEALMRTSWS